MQSAWTRHPHNPPVVNIAVQPAVRITESALRETTGRLTVNPSPSIHHTVIMTNDLDQSLAFYERGIGLSRLQDRVVTGDWPALFGAASTTLRAVFLGNPDVGDDHAGVLELNSFKTEPPAPSRSFAGPTPGLFLISFFLDVEATLQRLDRLGLGGSPHRVQQPTPNGPITIATVRDPDGVHVLLSPGSITAQRHSDL